MFPRIPFHTARKTPPSPVKTSANPRESDSIFLLAKRFRVLPPHSGLCSFPAFPRGFRHAPLPAHILFFPNTPIFPQNPDAQPERTPVARPPHQSKVLG
ncbi:hypothetical protein, partial [uncultured Bilophila sp.]